MKKTGTFLFVMLCFLEIIQGQSINYELNITHEGPDYARDIKPCLEGGFIVTGSTWNEEDEESDVYMVRLDEAGEVEWEQVYGGLLADEGFSVIQTPSDSGFLISGYTGSYGSGTYDFYLIKTDKDGEIDFTRTYGELLQEGSYSISGTLDGGFALAGYTSSQGSGGSDVKLIKINSSGTVLWSKTYGSSDDDEAFALLALADSGFIICGAYGLGSSSKGQAWVIRTESDGDTLWTKLYGADSYDDIARHIGTAHGRGFVVCGQTQSYGAGGFDAWWMHIDDDGTLLEQETYGGSGDEAMNHIIASYDGGYMMIGYSESCDTEADKQSYVLRTDNHGAELWSLCYGDELSDEAMAATLRLSDSTLWVLSSRDLGSSESVSYHVASLTMGCGVWYPRAMWVNSLACKGADTCYAGAPNVLADSSWAKQHTMLSYLKYNRIRELVIANAADIFMEDRNYDTTLINNLPQHIGDTLRRRFVQFLDSAKTHYGIDWVTVQLRHKGDEEPSCDSLVPGDTAPGITRNIWLLNEIKAMSDTSDLIDEIMVDYEFFNNLYGHCDTVTVIPAIKNEHGAIGWQYAKMVLDSALAVRNDSATYTIDKVSFYYGNMNIQTIDTTIGLKAIRELQANYLDSIGVDRIVLDFYVTDSTYWNPNTSYLPTNFLTGPDALPARLEAFGQNSIMTNISVVFSCEKYIDATPKGNNNFLGHWLEGTANTYWAGNPHYLRDAFVIFEEQYDSIEINSQPYGSVKINNYQWFTYGRSPLDSVREGDRAADYIDRYCSNQNRIMQNTFLQQRGKDKTGLSATDLVIELSPNPAEDFVDIESNAPMDEIVLYDSSFKVLQRFKANERTIRISMNQLGSGIYYIKIKTNNEIIKYTKLIKL